MHAAANRAYWQTAVGPMPLSVRPEIVNVAGAASIAEAVRCGSALPVTAA